MRFGLPKVDDKNLDGDYNTCGAKDENLNLLLENIINDNEVEDEDGLGIESSIVHFRGPMYID